MTGTFQSTPGQLSSFLAIQNNGTEQGYNTDGTLQQDQRDVHNSTHSILLAEVPIVVGDGSNGTVEGVAYREFRLNLGEAGNAKQYLSLDGLQIWQEESGSLTNFTSGAGFAGAHTNYLAYDLDAGGDHWIGLKEGLNGNGADQTEFTILIPDSVFINDPSHRYITLYSEFGMQAGWDADSSSEEWGLSHESGGPVSAMTVHKTATVPGGTANVAGEVIAYDITVANVGNTSLTGLTVTDPSVSNLAPVLSGGFNSGDTNHDNQLSAGETWHYSASHTVTQNDLNTNGGGDGTIDNTVTADSAQTTPVSATASVVVEQGSTIELVKTANVSSVNAAGNVINYTINVTNNGNTVLTFPDVNDSNVNIVTPIIDYNAGILGPNLIGPVIVGDYNAGDTNQNGFQDPGETFQYQIVGDTNNNGIEDPGETFVKTNVGDTNQNGSPDPGETFQFSNVGDTNHNGEVDSGETFQFSVSHAATPVMSGGFNAGDTNQNGQIDIGETWQYTSSYTVTQADIDNGGVVNPGLTHDNTATVGTSEGVTGSDSVSVSIVQNPHVTLTKTATVPGGTADTAGEVISYAIDVTNDGNMTLTGVHVTDSSATVTYVSGDTDGDNKLDLTETWHYTASSHTVTQDEIDNGGVVATPGTLTIDNTATVTTDQGTAPPNPDPDANDTGSASVPIVQNPQVTLDKTAIVPGGTADTAGEVISYTIDVANAGNMTLTGVTVSDPSVADLAAVMSGGFNSGDTNHDGNLNLGETWHYTASHTVTQSDIDTNGGGDGTIDNTASVSTAQGASANDTTHVTVVQPQTSGVTIDDINGLSQLVDPGGDGAGVGDLIQFAFQITNTGNTTLTSMAVSDTLGDIATPGNLQSPVPTTLAGGAGFFDTFNHHLTAADISAGHVVDDITVTALDYLSVSLSSTWHYDFHF